MGSIPVGDSDISLSHARVMLNNSSFTFLYRAQHSPSKIYLSVSLLLQLLYSDMKENPFNTATLLIRPDICTSLVTGLTGFHSKLETITDMTTNYRRLQLVNKTGSQQSDKRRFFSR